MVLLFRRAGSDPLSSDRIFSPISQTGEALKSIQVYAEPRGFDHVDISSWSSRNTDRPPRKICIMGQDDLGNSCGLASFTYGNESALKLCIAKVNMFFGDMNCTRMTNTILHEIGYCIGVFKHTTDEG
jgi:hypothetical protein